MISSLSGVYNIEHSFHYVFLNRRFLFRWFDPLYIGSTSSSVSCLVGADLCKPYTIFRLLMLYLPPMVFRLWLLWGILQHLIFGRLGNYRIVFFVWYNPKYKSTGLTIFLRIAGCSLAAYLCLFLFICSILTNVSTLFRPEKIIILPPRSYFRLGYKGILIDYRLPFIVRAMDFLNIGFRYLIIVNRCVLCGSRPDPY